MGLQQGVGRGRRDNFGEETSRQLIDVAMGNAHGRAGDGIEGQIPSGFRQLSCRGNFAVAMVHQRFNKTEAVRC